MNPDMSPAAISRRMSLVGELVEACRALRIKPGSVRPVVGAAGGAPPAENVVRFANHAGDQVGDQSSGQQQQSD